MSTSSIENSNNKEEQTPLASSHSSTATDEHDEKRGHTASVYEVTNEIENCLKDLQSELKSNDEKFGECIKALESKIEALE